MKVQEIKSVRKNAKTTNNFFNEMLIELKTNWQLYTLVILPICYIIVFKYFPMYGAQIAFRKYNPLQGISSSPWIGFDNFVRFFNSYQFWTLLRNTLLLSIYNLIASFPVPIILALALNYVTNVRFKKTVQMVTYIPHFISLVVIVGIMMQLLNMRTGVVNQLVTLITGESIDFIGEPKYFRSLFVWSGVWQQAGWNSIIYIAALSGIDPSLHEAAKVDGASKLRRIWHIDIPGILPTAVILFILNFGKIMTIGFEKVILMQNNLNVSVSEVIDTYVYKIGIASQVANFSYPAAIGLIQSVVTFILIIVVNRVSKLLTESSLW